MFAKRALLYCACVGALAFAGGCDTTTQVPGENDNSEDGGGMSTGAKVFFANLSGDQEVPSVDVASMGTATLTLSDDETQVSIDLSASGISGAVTGMHIHGAAAGVSGDIILDLTATVDDSGDGNVGASGSVSITAEVISAMRDGVAYLNIHTENNPAGEIRGQLGPPS